MGAIDHVVVTTNPSTKPGQGHTAESIPVAPNGEFVISTAVPLLPEKLVTVSFWELRAEDVVGNVATFVIEIDRLPDFISGEMIVEFDLGVTDPGDRLVTAALNSIDGDVMDFVPGVEHLLLRVGFLRDSMTVPEAISIIEQQPGVRAAAGNTMGVTLSGCPQAAIVDGKCRPNDPLLGPTDTDFGYGFLLFGGFFPRFDGGADAQDALRELIRAPNAWVLETGVREIVVALIDTGVDVAHPDLYRNIFINVNELPDSYADADFDGDGVFTFNDLNCDLTLSPDPPCIDALTSEIFKSQNSISDINGNGYIDADDFLACLDGFGDQVFCGSIFDGEDDDGNGYADDVFGINPASSTRNTVHCENSSFDGSLACVENLNDAALNDPRDQSSIFPEFASGHGTTIAGIIGAIGNNAAGIAGMSWRVRILPINVNLIIDACDANPNIPGC